MRDGAMDFGKGKKVTLTSSSTTETPKLENVKAATVIKEEQKPVEQRSNDSSARVNIVQPVQAEVGSTESMIKAESMEAVVKENEKTTAPPKTSKSRRKVVKSEDEGDGEENEQLVNEPSSSMVRSEERAAIEAMMGMDMEVDEPESSGTAKNKSRGRKSETRSKQNMTSGMDVPVKVEPGARKRRKVKKTTTEEDEKGYMGTA